MNIIKNQPGFTYPLKVWLITVLAAPFVLMFTLGIYNAASLQNFFTGLPLFFIIMACGTVLAIPALFLSWFFYIKIRALSIPVWQQKMLFSITGTGFIVVTFLIVDSDFLLNSSADGWLWPGSYAIALIVAICIVKMKASAADK